MIGARTPQVLPPPEIRFPRPSQVVLVSSLAPLYLSADGDGDDASALRSAGAAVTAILALSLCVNGGVQVSFLNHWRFSHAYLADKSFFSTLVCRRCGRSALACACEGKRSRGRCEGGESGEARAIRGGACDSGRRVRFGGATHSCMHVLAAAQATAYEATAHTCLFPCECAFKCTCILSQHARACARGQLHTAMPA
eukprot:2780360-Pleurochrysis_carterae.AAC.1